MSSKATNSSSAAPVSVSGYTELESGLRLGGVWKDLYDNCMSATAQRDDALKELDSLRRENSELHTKMDRLNGEHLNNLSSLTKHKTSNWQLENILDAIREEKSALESKCCAYETQIKWLDKQREQQQNDNAIKSKDLEGMMETNKCLERDLNLSEERNNEMHIQMQEKQRLLEFKDKRIDSFEKINGVLQKSLKIKEKQLSDQVKNAQLLNETIEELKKSILPKYRNIVFLKVNEKTGALKAKTPAFTPMKSESPASVAIVPPRDDASSSGIDCVMINDDEKFTPLKTNYESPSDINIQLFSDENDEKSAANPENVEVIRLKNLLLLARLECKAVKEELEFMKSASNFTGCVKGALIKQRATSKATNAEFAVSADLFKTASSPMASASSADRSPSANNSSSNMMMSPVRRVTSSVYTPHASPSQIPSRTQGGSVFTVISTPKKVSSSNIEVRTTNIPSKKL